MFFYDLIEVLDLFIDISKCLNISLSHTIHSIFMSVNSCIGGNIQRQKMCFIFRRQLQQQLVCLKKLKTVAEVSFYNLTERERPGERRRWQQTADSAPVIQTVVLARRGKVKTRTHATSQHMYPHIHITHIHITHNTQQTHGHKQKVSPLSWHSQSYLRCGVTVLAASRQSAR